MSADTRPLSPSRFAAALKGLSIGMLHLKALEIRNSIAHLQFSNHQLKPFAEGTATPLAGPSASSSAAAPAPDQDCIDAICENEHVISRMAERLAIIRTEVQDRGVSWAEFQSKDELENEGNEGNEGNREDHAAGAHFPNHVANGEAAVDGNAVAAGEEEGNARQQSRTRHLAWTDGTFQTGAIRGGQVHLDDQHRRPSAGGSGGSLSDEQLRAALEEHVRNLGIDYDNYEAGGLHL